MGLSSLRKLKFKCLTGRRDVWVNWKEMEKKSGHSGFQNMGYWSSGMCSPFFRVATYLKFELLDGNEKEKNCLGCENQLLGGDPVGTGNSLSQHAVGARSLDAVSGKLHGVQLWWRLSTAKATFQEICELEVIWRLAEHPGEESLHAAFFFSSFLCIPLLILAGDRILCQAIWPQVTWPNTSRLSYTGWSQLWNEIMSLAHSKQTKVNY